MWSWVLACIGIAGIFLVGRKTIWGWLILCVNECLWIAYALSTDQYGFIFMAVAYAAVYIKSFIHWKRDEQCSAIIVAQDQLMETATIALAIKMH